MSSAAVVPETRDLTGDDAVRTLRRVGRRRLLKEAFVRLRVADGFSHARSLAFLTALVLVQGVVALVGLASAVGQGRISATVVATVQRAVPGPAGRVLTAAVAQAHHTAVEHRYSAVVLGTIGCLISATTALGQIERGLNRIYGVEQDRPTVRKYGRAFGFALGVGTLTAAAFACVTFGNELLHDSPVWRLARWPFGLALFAVATTLLFRYTPRRTQPQLSWLAFGSGVTVVLWGVVTAALSWFYGSSSSFGATYGPLAGLVALLLWCVLSSIALFYGAAVAAQLEAMRAGASRPQDMTKVKVGTR